MTAMANDRRRGGGGGASRAAARGCLGRVVRAVGPLARGLTDVGWSPGAVVLARIAIAALVVAPLAAAGAARTLGSAAAQPRIVLLYGVVPVAGTQFAYFSAVAAMDVGPRC